MDVCARGLKAAAAMLEDGDLAAARTDRYSGWDAAHVQDMLKGGQDGYVDHVSQGKVDPAPRSGRQERLENIVNRYVYPVHLALTIAPVRGFGMVALRIVESATPLQHLSRLSDHLGIELFVNRDALAGPSFGGNKSRQLEY